jgi:hypothetical protein
MKGGGAGSYLFPHWLATECCSADRFVLITHVPIIYKETKPQMSSLLVFNRVNRLMIQSVMLVFSTPLVN